LDMKDTWFKFNLMGFNLKHHTCVLTINCQISGPCRWYKQQTQLLLNAISSYRENIIFVW
jgi:hypothetical protein